LTCMALPQRPDTLKSDAHADEHVTLVANRPTRWSYAIATSQVLGIVSSRKT